MTGLPGSKRTKPVTDRRSTVSAIRAECEICRLAILGCLVLLTGNVAAQTCDQYVAQGRAHLANTNLAAAETSFAAAVAACPNHETANAFLAGLRLLTLVEKPAGSNLLTRLGFPTTNRSLYAWEASLPRDTNGVPLAPAGVSAAETTAFFRTNVLPAVLLSAENLARITNTGFLLTLSTNETRATEEVTLDYADIQLLRAMASGLEYFAYTTYSWNADAQFTALRGLYEGTTTLGGLLATHTSLLRYATTNDLIAARAAFVAGVDQYEVASALIRGRDPALVRLFNYSPSDSEDELRFRETLQDLKAALVAVTPLSADTNYSVFLAPHFAGQTPMRSFLPLFRENRFALGTLPDLSFSGSITGLTLDEVEESMAEVMDTVPTLGDPTLDGSRRPNVPFRVQPGRGYVLQTSTNLLAWQDVHAFVPFIWDEGFADPQPASGSRRFYRLVDATGNMPVPVNDTFASRITISGLGVSVTGYNSSAGSEPNEPLDSYCPAGRTVWYSWTAPVSGPITIQAGGSPGFWPNVRVFTGSDLASLVLVGGGGSFTVTAGVTYQIQVDGSCWDAGEGGFILIVTQPPVVTLLSPPSGAVYEAPATITCEATASDPDGFIAGVQLQLSAWPVFSDIRSFTNPPYAVTWSNVPPGSYSVYADARDNLGVYGSAYRSIRVRPPNDDFVNRQGLSGAQALTNGTTGGASKESGEPFHAGSSGGASVWYAWTAPASGPVTVLAETYAGWDAPLLGIYTGTTVSGLSAVASAYNTLGDSRISQATFQAVGGVTYQIAVDGPWGYQLAFVLKVMSTAPPLVQITSPTNNQTFHWPVNLAINVSANDPEGALAAVQVFGDGALRGSVTGAVGVVPWSGVGVGWHTIRAVATDNAGAMAVTSIQVQVIYPPPPNDAFAQRQMLYGTSVMLNASNNGASKEVLEPNHAGNAGGRSVWWSWTAPYSGSVTLSTTGSAFNTLLGVYTGSALGALLEVASDDDGGGNLASRVGFKATGGATYRIAVDGYAGASGSVVLTLSMP